MVPNTHNTYGTYFIKMQHVEELLLEQQAYVSI